MSTLITNIRLWDGLAERAMEGAALLIVDERVAWAGARGDAPEAASGAEVVDGDGGTLLPGLIDAHIHLGWGGASARAEETTLRNAAAALATGITAARDLGAPSHAVITAARAIARGEAPGPHLIAAGRPVAMPGGYAPGVAAEADSPEAVRAAVAAQVAAGAGIIKVIASPVPAGPEVRVPRSFGEASLAAAAGAAHAVGLRITAHAHSLDGARDAVAAGFDCIEHGYRLDAATIAEMARRGTWLVPTLVAMEAAQAPQMAPGRPPETAARARERWEAAVEAARQAHRAGVRIAAGTDAITNVPVTAIRREVALLIEAAGMSPVQALRAATSDAAVLLGIAQETGRIHAGLRADLLLLAGDPLDDPAALSEVRGVWRSGERR